MSSRRGKSLMTVKALSEEALKLAVDSKVEG
ncbi:MAG: hypothetical protein ACI837_002864 [Crocinitomicaceae bacterium]|jgi:hypothetical protein